MHVEALHCTALHCTALHCNVLHCRDTNMNDKLTARAAAKIENGEKVESLGEMSLETASWMMTRGEGMGKMIWR